MFRNSLRQNTHDEEPQFLPFRSQWKLYPNVNDDMSLGQIDSFKSFFQSTKWRTFSFCQSHVNITEDRGFRKRYKHRLPSLLVVSPNDFHVNHELRTITIRPSRGNGWSMELKLTTQIETEEVEEKLKEICEVTPLEDMLSADFGEAFPKMVKVIIWDQLNNYNGPAAKERELNLFYTNTLLKMPTVEQLYVVQKIYDTFYKNFAEGRPQRVVPIAVANIVTEDNQDESLLRTRTPEVVENIFFSENKVEEIAPTPMPIITQSIGIETDARVTNEIAADAKATDAKSFANLLAYAAKHDIVRAIFLYFDFTDTFVDGFNLNEQKNNRSVLTGPEVLNKILKQIVHKSNGLWGKNVKCVLMRLLSFPGPNEAESSVLPSSTHDHESKGNDDDLSDDDDDDDDDDDEEESRPRASTTNSLIMASFQPSPFGFASLDEAEWLKKTNAENSVTRTSKNLTFNSFEELMSTGNVFVPRHFLLAAKCGHVKSVLSKIPADMAGKAFEVIKDVGEDQDAKDASPIISALVMHGCTSKDKKILFQCVNNARLINDSFFRMFLRAALCGSRNQDTQPQRNGRVFKGNTKLVKRFMDKVFFSKNRKKTDYNTENIRRVRFLAPILFQELCSAISKDKIKINDDRVNVLFEYALRFESLPKEYQRISKEVTLHHWIEDDRPTSGGSGLLQGWSRLQLFSKHMRDNRYFTKLLSDILAPNEELMNLNNRNKPINVLEDLNGDSKQRRRVHLLNALQGFLSTSFFTICVSNELSHEQQGEGETKENNLRPDVQSLVRTETDNEIHSLEHFLKLPKMGSFFEMYWKRGGVRESITEDLLTYGISSAYEEHILNDTLLSKPGHFRSGVIQALKETPDCLEDHVFQSLLLASIRLEEYDQLIPRLHSIEHQIYKTDESIRQLNNISMAVLDRNEDEFKEVDFSLENVRDCANYAAAAKRIVSQQAKSIRRLQCAFDHYLKSMSPSAWLGLFKSAETIAFFIKYLERENLSKAYEAYETGNKENNDILDRLNRIKKIFTGKLFSKG